MLECWSVGVMNGFERYSITPLLHRSGSDLNRALENKFRRAGKRDITKLILSFFKADLQFVAAPREDSDWPFAILTCREDERAGDYSRPAGERFVFYASFIGADRYFVGSAFFDEVHVCAVWLKHFKMTNRCALAAHIGIIDFCNGDHDMRDATVDEVNHLVLSRRR